MDQPYNITVKIKSTGETVKLKGKIPSEDWTTLLRFRDEAKKLLTDIRDCENLNVNFSLSWNREDGVLRPTVKKTVKSSDLAIILHRLRPFILQKEPFEFKKTVNLLQKHIKHEFTKELFKSFKDLFSDKEFQRHVYVTLPNILGDTPVNSDRMLMNWINAFEYHRDDGKRKLIQKIDKILPEQIRRSLFVSMVMDKVIAVAKVRGIVSAIKKRGGFEIEF